MKFPRTIPRCSAVPPCFSRLLLSLLVWCRQDAPHWLIRFRHYVPSEEVSVLMNKILALAFIGAFAASSLPAGEVLEDVVEKSFPLDPSGTFSLHAIDGIIEIFGSDSREVTISATKKAFSPERLNAIAIRIDARSDAINIETTSPPEPRHHFMDRSGTVEYSINLPQTARIARVELPNGELVIKGMRGGP